MMPYNFWKLAFLLTLGKIDHLMMNFTNELQCSNCQVDHLKKGSDPAPFQLGQSLSTSPGCHLVHITIPLFTWKASEINIRHVRMAECYSSSSSRSHFAEKTHWMTSVQYPGVAWIKGYRVFQKYIYNFLKSYNFVFWLALNLKKCKVFHKI